MTGITISKILYSSFRPLILSCRFFCFMPVICEKLDGQKYFLKTSKLVVIYSYFLGTFLSVFSLSGVINDIFTEKENSVRAKGHKDVCILLADVGVVIVSVYFHIFFNPKRILFFFKILQNLNELEPIIPRKVYKKQRNFSIIVMTIVYIFFFCTLSYDPIVWRLGTNYKHEYSQILRNYGGHYVLYLFLVTQEIFYCLVLYILRDYIKCFNQYLLSLIKNKEKWGVFEQAYEKPVWVKKYQRYIQLSSGNYTSVTKDAVQGVIQIHTNLYDCVININKYFGLPVLLIISSTIMHLIITPFVLLTGERKSISIHFKILQILWIFIHMGRLSIIIEPVYQTLNQFKKTKLLLCRFYSATEEGEQRKKMKLFSSQLELCEFKFTAFSVASMTKSILATTAGTVATYVVILIQLKE